MARLICTGITSLDGFVTDADGGFDWAAPDPEVHAFVNDVERPIGTYLYGRRLYEVMSAWEDLGSFPAVSEVERDYARLWQGADKVVFSRTLREASTARTRLAREFEPESIRRLVAEADRDVSIGGPTLAAHALRAGLVDEVQQFLHPVVVGGGTRFLPDELLLGLDLLDVRRFDSGVVYLRYRSRV